MPVRSLLPRRTVVTLTLAALAISVFAGDAGAQEDVASAIVDTPAAGFALLVSDRVDIGSLDPDSESEIADAWIKSFSDGTNSISIVATQFADSDGLQAGLAGAMSQIALEDRRLSPDHEGVVIGPIVQQGVVAEFAVYGEGTISFAIAVLGPDRGSVLEEAIENQITHSIGDRYELSIDENERFLDDDRRGAPFSRGVTIAIGVATFLVVFGAARWVGARRAGQ